MQGTITRRGPYRSSSVPINGEQTATVKAAKPNAAETASRDQPKAPLRGFTNVPKLKTSSEPKLTITPKYAAATMRHGAFSAANSGADVAMLRAAFASRPVRLFGKRVHSAGINPLVIEIEQSADRDRE